MKIRLIRLHVRSEVKEIVYRMSEILFAAEIAFCRLGRMHAPARTESAQARHRCCDTASHRFSAHAACGMIVAMPNPGLCRIEYEASAFGAELAHQDDQVDSA